MEALAVFQSIINRGIVIVTLSNEAEYSLSSLNSDWTGLMPLLVSMGRANQESERKSFLLSNAWKKKKDAASQHATPLGNTAPHWIIYSKQDGYALHPERSAIVRRIFQMSIDGRGREAIAKILNEEGIAAFKGGEWGTTSLSRILSSRVTIGEYTPHRLRKPVGDPVPNFFPSVIDTDTFYQAQAASASRKINRSTKQLPNFNLWSGVGLCADCKGAMHIVTKQRKYLCCANKRKGTCSAKPIRLDESESVFMEILATVGDKSLVEQSSQKQEERLQAMQGDLSFKESRYALSRESFEQHPSTAVAEIIGKIENELIELREQIRNIKASLASDRIWDRDAFFDDVDLVSYEGRSRANALIKRLNLRVYMVRETDRTRYTVFNQESSKGVVMFQHLAERGIIHTPLTQWLATVMLARDINPEKDNIDYLVENIIYASKFEGKERPDITKEKILKVLKWYRENPPDISDDDD
jgi:DNA invertase Pin-like site-specific DNA recombinase